MVDFFNYRLYWWCCCILKGKNEENGALRCLYHCADQHSEGGRFLELEKKKTDEGGACTDRYLTYRISTFDGKRGRLNLRKHIPDPIHPNPPFSSQKEFGSTVQHVY
jgi:hypothetical protein